MKAEMKVRKEMQRTRRVVAEVNVDKETKCTACVADHVDTENAHVTRAGTEVSISIGPVRERSVMSIVIPIKAWPLVREIADKAIAEFGRQYPESPK